MRIMSIDRLAGGLAPFLHAAKDTPIQSLALKACGPSLESVQPRGTRGREVQLHAWVSRKLGFERGGGGNSDSLLSGRPWVILTELSLEPSLNGDENV